MHRWACHFKQLPAARRPIPGHYHQLRRHRTVSADQLGHILPVPAATVPVGPLLPSATNRPGVTTIVGYFGPSLPHIPATTPSSSPHEKLTPPSRAPQASLQTHFKRPLLRQRLRLHVRCGTRTFHRRVRDPTPFQPTILIYSHSLVFFRHRAPTASSANTPSSLVRAWSSSTRFTGPSSVARAPTTSSANPTMSPSRDRSAAARPPAVFHRIFPLTLHHPVPRSTYGVPSAHFRGSPSTDRGVYNAMRQGYLQPGIIALSRTYTFVFLSLPLTIFLEFLLEFLLLEICFVRITP